MKKDIQIPKVEGIYIAVVHEYNAIYKSRDWNVYIINDTNVDLEMVLIVSSGYSDKKATSVFRKRIDSLPRKSYAKIELIHEDLFALNNTFKVSFFQANKLYDKTFVFSKNTIHTRALRNIPLMDVKGVLAK